MFFIGDMFKSDFIHQNKTYNDIFIRKNDSFAYNYLWLMNYISFERTVDIPRASNKL